MSLASMIFLFLFLPCFYAIYYLFPSYKAKEIVLAVGTILFCCFYHIVSAVFFVLSVLINSLLGWLQTKKHKKEIMVISILFNVIVLAISKYFFAFSFLPCYQKMQGYFPLLGISFYTFSMITYHVAIFKNQEKKAENPLSLFNFAAAFPRITAGPIVRYDSPISYRLGIKKMTKELFAKGARRFIIGLAKKVILADTLSQMCQCLLSYAPSEYGMAGAWIILILYTVQIYLDFSGYCDMAIGLGETLGFVYPENFDYPYMAVSLSEFWRRWHKTLSFFFRDYVYIPLGGNRVTKGRFILNMFIVWGLTGIWHGSHVNFLIWGLYYALLLVLEKTWWRENLREMPVWFKHIYTLFFVTIGWGIFAITDLSVLRQFFGSAIGIYGRGEFSFLVYTQIITVKNIVIVFLSILASFPILPHIKRHSSSLKLIGTIEDVMLIGIAFLCTVFLLKNSYTPFIYAHF